MANFGRTSGPGLGVELDMSRLTLLSEYDTYRARMLMTSPRRLVHEQ